MITSLLGIVLVMASGCVANNYLDRKIDSKMLRTKNRVLVTGIITPLRALFFATVLGLAGFIMLAVFTNLLTVAAGVLALIDYVFLYGISKRKTIHSTLVGSVAGALPPVAGYLAVTDRIDGAALMLFVIMVFWQMVHFYAIAIYRRNEYKSAGLPILSVIKGTRATQNGLLIYTALFTLSVSLLTLLGYTGIIFLIVMMAGCFYWLKTARNSEKYLRPEIWAKQIFVNSLKIIIIFDVLLAFNWLLP